VAKSLKNPLFDGFLPLLIPVLDVVDLPE